MRQNDLIPLLRHIVLLSVGFMISQKDYVSDLEALSLFPQSVLCDLDALTMEQDQSGQFIYTVLRNLE